MMEELPYRIAIILLLAGMKTVRLCRRRCLGWKASWSAAKKNPVDGVVLAVCQSVWTAALVVYVCCPQWVSFAHLDMPLYLRWGGSALGITGILVVAWADHHLGNNLSGIVQIKDEQTLVTAGPYRWVRHPIYTGGLLSCCGHFLLSANWCVGACCCGGAALLYVTRISREEKMMLAKFGDDYRHYIERTGRLLPRIISR